MAAVSGLAERQPAEGRRLQQEIHKHRCTRTRFISISFSYPSEGPFGVEITKIFFLKKKSPEASSETTEILKMLCNHWLLKIQTVSRLSHFQWKRKRFQNLD